jgi:hypothetical protein
VLEIGKAGVILLFGLGLSPVLGWSQTAVPDQFSAPALLQPSTSLSDSTPEPTAAEPPSNSENAAAPDPNPAYLKKYQKKKEDPVEGEQTKRMLWVVPNFAAVSANTELPPLTARGKFSLAVHDSMDYSGFTWTAIISGQALAMRSDPEFGHGIKAYGRYYWRAFADGLSGTFFTEAIVPAITREDPRYYTMGHGGFFRRMGYALSRTVVTKTDSGGTTFNISEVVGNALEAGLSNAYYPPEERGLRQTGRNWATQMESAAVNNIAKEFWPDIRNKFFRRNSSTAAVE